MITKALKSRLKDVPRRGLTLLRGHVLEREACCILEIEMRSWRLIMDEFYDQYAALHPTLHREDAPRKIGELRSVIPSSYAASSMVDVGCGLGLITSAIADTVGVRKGIALDISSETIKI